MKINLVPPTALHERGRRSNNEDTLFPPIGAASCDDRLFLVCDGVGGADKGEVAGEIACRTISNYFLQHSLNTRPPQIVWDAIAFAEAEMERCKVTRPETAQMATTLTLLYLHEDGATVAHVGDSRVYHIREGCLRWRTQDHSYVNELVKSGIITAEEAPGHPKRNVITRALQGSTNAVAPDIHLVEDVQAGDYFFMCTDGVLESFSDTELLELLGSNESDVQKIATIKSKCTEHSRDNFTAYLIPIRSVEQLRVELLPSEKKESPIQVKKPAQNTAATGLMKPWMMVLIVVNLMLVSTIAWLLWGKKEYMKPKKQPTEVRAEPPVMTSEAEFSDNSPKNEIDLKKKKKKNKKVQ